ncbi:MAG: hypothetical protein AAFO01_16350 [Pseudomonadota bacterium]
MSLNRSFAASERLDLEAIEKGLMQGRRLRSKAFASLLSGLFARRKEDRTRADDRLADCAIPA